MSFGKSWLAPWQRQKEHTMAEDEQTGSTAQVGALKASVGDSSGSALTEMQDDASDPLTSNRADSPTLESREPEAADTAMEDQPLAIPATSVADVVSAVDPTPQGKVAIIDLANALKSANNTAGQVDQAAGQSFEAKQGAQVAHTNALSVLLKRWEAAVVHLGEEVATDVRAALVKLHGVDKTVVATITDAAEDAGAE